MEQKMMLVILVAMISTAASPSTAQHQGTDDRLALLAFKDRISDPRGVLSSWNNTTPLCNWDGVECGNKNSQRVVGLNLTSRGLRGTISPEIGNLTFLRIFDLKGNNLYGEIPQELGRLLRLQEINLANNSFHGFIPTNLTLCSKLIYMDFSNNQLPGPIPSDFGSITSLEYFKVTNNSLTGTIPSSFGNLSSLKIFGVTTNHLEGSIPEELARLQRLSYFLAGDNMFHGIIPPHIFNISSLEVINVAKNGLHGSIPENIGINLPNLTKLQFGGNKFSGHIPVSLSNATKLSLIDLSYNLFSGPVLCDFGGLRNLYRLNLAHNNLEAHNSRDWKFFDSLRNSSQLTVLGLSENQFGGELPASVANLSTQLTGLYMGSNNISGSIPSGIEKLVNLNVLDMSHNLLTGSVPIGIGNLDKLQVLGLSFNNITGNIPSSLGNLSQVLSLDLSMNNLDGLIPSTFGNLQKVDVLDLSNNNLNGSIPKELLRISSMSRYMDLSSNSLSGSLPDVGAMKTLAIFSISGNKLSGKIPSTLANFEALQILSLENNNFEGAVPTALAELKGLEFLDISANKLAGPIPESLQNLIFLYHLNLSFNNLEGPVPTEGVFKNASALTLFGNDRLCGGIPELKLPACSSLKESRRKREEHVRIKIIIPTVLATTLCMMIIVALVVFYKKTKTRKGVMPFVKDQFPKVTYRKLVEATNQFSSTNLIGEGRYSKVYKGTLALGGGTLVVAIKVLDLQVRGASKSFDTECKVLRRVKHRNLLKILTSCSSLDSKGDEFKALVFEYMPRGSLDEWLHPQVQLTRQSHGLSLLEKLNIAIDIGRALEYLHHSCQPPILHCDIKPSNVLLDDDIVAHVGDFGIAKIVSTTTHRLIQKTSNTIAIRGSIGYVAPEYGAGALASTAGDVYSYGILLLEMVTGKRPVDDKFKDGLTLRGFAETNASYQRIMEVADPLMLFCKDQQIKKEQHGGSDQVNDMRQCLLSIVEVGLQCSAEAPNERISIATAANKMHKIRDKYFGNIAEA